MKRPALVLTTIGLLAAAVTLLAPRALATGVTDLGPPTNDLNRVPDSGPLAFFHYIKASLHQGPKPELLFLGVQLSEQVEAERWPVIKALSQFGSFSGVSAQPNFSHTASPSFPSFNLDHMVYRSRYVAFVNKDLLKVHCRSGSGCFGMRPFRKLTRQERALFDKYSNPLGPRAKLALAAEAAVLRPGSKVLPLVAIDGYVQTSPTLPVSVGDFLTGVVAQASPCPGPQATCPGGPTYSGVNASFSDVQRSLVAGRAAGGLPQSLVTDVNAEANIITALICHADGKKPSSVCNRRVIRSLSRHVK